MKKSLKRTVNGLFLTNVKLIIINKISIFGITFCFQTQLFSLKHKLLCPPQKITYLLFLSDLKRLKTTPLLGTKS